MQTKLQNIIKRVESDGFIYPHSGKFVSTRTNSILYEILEYSREANSHPALFIVWLNLDRIVSALAKFIDNVFVSWVIKVGAALIIAYSFWSWYQLFKSAEDLKPGSGFANYYFGVVPNFIASFLLALFFLRKNR
jgi:hypothetical protein